MSEPKEIPTEEALTLPEDVRQAETERWIDEPMTLGELRDAINAVQVGMDDMASEIANQIEIRRLQRHHKAGLAFLESCENKMKDRLPKAKNSDIARFYKVRASAMASDIERFRKREEMRKGSSFDPFGHGEFEIGYDVRVRARLREKYTTEYTRSERERMRKALDITREALVSLGEEVSGNDADG